MRAVFKQQNTKYNTNSDALPLLGLCSAKLQCHVTRSTKYVTAQNACLHSAEVAVKNVHLSVCCGRITPAISIRH